MNRLVGKFVNVNEETKYHCIIQIKYSLPTRNMRFCISNDMMHVNFYYVIMKVKLDFIYNIDNSTIM